MNGGPSTLEPPRCWREALEKTVEPIEQWTVSTVPWLLAAIGVIKKSLSLICVNRSLCMPSMADQV